MLGGCSSPPGYVVEVELVFQADVWMVLAANRRRAVAAGEDTLTKRQIRIVR